MAVKTVQFLKKYRKKSLNLCLETYIITKFLHTVHLANIQILAYIGMPDMTADYGR